MKSAVLMYLRYDSEQATYLLLQDYFNQIANAIFATGYKTPSQTDANGDQIGKKSITTSGLLSGISDESHHANLTEEGLVNITDHIGNLYWKKNTGFRVRTSDTGSTWSVMKTTYSLTGERNEGEGNWPIAFTAEIPLQVQLSISLASISYIREGAHLADQGALTGLKSTEDAEVQAVLKDLGYKKSEYVTDHMLLMDDSIYTAYVELAYSGDRLMMDNRMLAVDGAGGLILSTVKEMEGDPLYVQKTSLIGDRVYKDQGYPELIQIMDNGNPLLDADGNPVYVIKVTPYDDSVYTKDILLYGKGEPILVKAIDRDGNPVTDTDGNFIFVQDTRHNSGFAFDDRGKPLYETLMTPDGAVTVQKRTGTLTVTDLLYEVGDAEYEVSPITVPTSLQLVSEGNEGLTYAKGTVVTMFNLDTKRTYVYEVMQDGLTSIPMTSFIDMENENEHYELCDASLVTSTELMDALITSPYTINKGSRQYKDNQAGLERFLIQVSFQSSDGFTPVDATTPTDLKTFIGLDESKMTPDQKEKKTFQMAATYTDNIPVVDFSPRRHFSISMRSSALTFNRVVPLSVIMNLNDSVSPNYDYSKDLINQETPFLEIAYTISNDLEGFDVIDVPQGTYILFGSSKLPVTKAVNGAAMFCLEGDNVYCMEETFAKKNADGSVVTASDTGKIVQEITDQFRTVETNISIDLDFSHTSEYQFKPGEVYYLQVNVYRTANPDYPLGGSPVATLTIPIRMEAQETYGFRMDMTEIGDINCNMSEITSTDIEFTTMVTNATEGSNITEARYVLYRKDPVTGLYEEFLPEEGVMKLSLQLFGGDTVTSTDLANGAVSWKLWRYLNGTLERTKTGVASSTNVTAYVKVADGQIAEIKYTSVNVSGTDMKNDPTIKADLDAIIDLAKQNNGISGIAGSSDAEQAFIKAVQMALCEMRVGADTVNESDIILYVDGDGNVCTMSDIVRVHNNTITDLKVMDGTTNFSDVVSWIKDNWKVDAHTAVKSAPTNAEKALLESVLDVLTHDRTVNNVSDPCRLVLSITDENYTLPTGNYKLVGHLQIKGVDVATDNIVFNVNRMEIDPSVR